MPGRKFSPASQYRYGFNGQEKSTEIKGEGNSYTAEFWEFDPRLGRRWNMDPIYKNSPYETFGNNPILLVDPKGADTTINGNRYKDLQEVVIKSKSKMTISKLEKKYPGMMNLAKDGLNSTIGGLYTGRNNTYKQEDPGKIDYLSEFQKQQIFKENAAKTTAILLREFQMGTGRETRYFNEFQHPIVNEIKWSIQANSALNAFAQDIKNGNIQNNKEYYYYGGSSPDKIPILASIKAHANQYMTTPSAFYRGGMRFYFTKTTSLIIVRAEDEFNIASMLPNSRSESDNIYREGHVRPFGQTKAVFQFYYTKKDGLDFSK